MFYMKKRVHIFQPQYEAVLSNKSVQPWLPYSAACLWAYAQSFDDIRENWQLEKLHYQRLPIEDVVNSISDPDVCAFSCYVWNEQYNLKVAEAIKKRWPNCKIIFGGPQTGNNHLEYNFIDCIVFSEGEISFRDILRKVHLGQHLEKIIKTQRLDNLNIPSPYLLGLFDDIVDNAPSNVSFQTVLETNRGCPFQCTFCDWGTLTYSKVRKFSLERVEAELRWLASKPISVIFLADANFGILKQRDMEIAKMMNSILAGSRVEYMNVTYTKNSNSTVFEIAKTIINISKSVTLSVQSMNPDTLKVIKRDNMKSNDLEDMLRLAKEYQIPTYTDMILGLPLETLQSWKMGILELLERGQDSFIDGNFTNILENTELNHIQRQKYGIKSIRVGNYQGFSEMDRDGVHEYTELITETNTMSTEDMVEAWMWHWLIQFFHTAGYSNLAANYSKNVLNKSYLEFYENLYERVSIDQGPIGNEFRKIKRMAFNLLTTGNFGNEMTNVYDFYITSYLPFWKNIEETMKLVEATVIDLHGDPYIMMLQRHALVNPVWPSNVELDSPWNLDTWQKENKKYKVKSILSNFDGSYESFRNNRRGVYWRNKFEPV